MHRTNHEAPGNVSSFAPEEMVNASELKDWAYCNRSWFLNQQGFRVTEKAAEERLAGIAFHEERAEAAMKGSNRQALWWAILLALLGIVFLLMKTLIESRR
jgi:hypothetical protein